MVFREPEVPPMQTSEETKKAQVNRLRRIEGQVRGLQRLIEDDNDCVDVLTQVSATTRALESFAIQLVEQHLQACVREASQDGVDPEAKVMEITAAIARLVRS
ncbi:MAG: metal-sensitive transcriptional regulator [Actinobacteria bacterium]|jgi:DNA-binding FrmR family transcriptional regulator|nr:metal-sensitive transcriptional regulator [Micrococcales bacterium]MCB0904929.1 metal-sensitive transcriptional regulator [Actinomycetota bacterium]MCB9427596.1 metal-sensitive transcriptional regulator [Actinomycetota bacterium]